MHLGQILCSPFSKDKWSHGPIDQKHFFFLQSGNLKVDLINGF